VISNNALGMYSQDYKRGGLWNPESSSPQKKFFNILQMFKITFDTNINISYTIVIYLNFFIINQI